MYLYYFLDLLMKLNLDERHKSNYSLLEERYGVSVITAFAQYLSG